MWHRVSRSPPRRYICHWLDSTASADRGSCCNEPFSHGFSWIPGYIPGDERNGGRGMFAQRRAVVANGALSMIAVTTALVSAPDAAAQSDRAVRNDPRATFVGKNAT